MSYPERYKIVCTFHETASVSSSYLLIWTTQMIFYFSLILILKLNLNCIAWSKQQEALVSMWTQIKQITTRILNKMELLHIK